MHWCVLSGDGDEWELDRGARAEPKCPVPIPMPTEPDLVCYFPINISGVFQSDQSCRCIGPCSSSQSDFHPYLQVPTRCPASKHSSKGSNCTIGFSEPHRCLHLHSVIQSGAVKQSLEAEIFLGFFVACHQICRLGVELSCQAHALGRRREFGDASLVRIDEFLLLGQQGPRARSSRR
jgi:hypothetical protein